MCCWTLQASIWSSLATLPAWSQWYDHELLREVVGIREHPPRHHGRHHSQLQGCYPVCLLESSYRAIEAPQALWLSPICLSALMYLFRRGCELDLGSEWRRGLKKRHPLDEGDRRRCHQAGGRQEESRIEYASCIVLLIASSPHGGRRYRRSGSHRIDPAERLYAGRIPRPGQDVYFLSPLLYWQDDNAMRVIEDAKALEEAGCFSVVVECVWAQRRVSRL